MTTETVIDSLNVAYRGTELSVELMDPPGAELTVRLKINGILRDSKSQQPPCRLQLSTSVQTDYEWHEFIEARIDCSDANIQITIDANSARIADESYSLDTDR